MRPLHLLFAATLLASASAQDSDTAEGAQLDTDSLIAAFQCQTGAIQLADGVATVDVPSSHKFLGADQAYHLLVDIWQNPPEITEDLLGVVLQADADVYDDRPAYVVYYEENGYVHDRDAGRIDYDAKLPDMIREDSLNNEKRRAAGYSGLQLVGWASPPYYDRSRKALHWAKELVSDGSESNVLNYNIRILGRHGVLVINAISTMDHLDEVNQELPAVLGMAAFNDGYRHDQYVPAIDGASSKGLGSLIDGKDQEAVKDLLKTALMIGAGGFVALLLLHIGLWHLVVRKRR